MRLAGLFPLQGRDFDHTYRSRFHALHLHEYAGVIRLGGAQYPLEPGTLTLSPAGDDSSYHLPRAGMHWCIHFDLPAAELTSPRVAVSLVRALGALQADAIARFANIARLRGLELATTAPGTRAMARAGASLALQELLVWAGMIDTLGTSPAPRPGGDGIDGLVDYIDRNLGRPLRAGRLAARAGLSQNYLARLFRQRIGMTIPRYVLTRRVAVARLLLETTNLPVKQVALRVGLPDPHHFNKQFRALTGQCPTYCRAAGRR